MSEKVFLEKQPYSILANVYDKMMSYVNYSDWIDFVEEVFAETKTQPTTILELACGTGNLTLELAKRGYEVFGTDYSQEMIEIAKEKAGKQKLKANFQKMDMRNLVFEQKFDAVLCLFDGINYLTELEDLKKTLENAFSLLNGNGILIFDLATETNSLRNFNGYFEKNFYKSIVYTRESFYNQEEKIHTTEIKITLPKKQGSFLETHFQKIYSIEEIFDLVKKLSCKKILTFDGFCLEQPSKDSDRINFVLLS
ncbi:class I SAM-dependent methyltransferase [bacterium]|nr:class I SAM-dependent methyltransferase [bacterium]